MDLQAVHCHTPLAKGRCREIEDKFGLLAGKQEVLLYGALQSVNFENRWLRSEDKQFAFPELLHADYRIHACIFGSEIKFDEMLEAVEVLGENADLPSVVTSDELLVEEAAYRNFHSRNGCNQCLFGCFVLSE